MANSEEPQEYVLLLARKSVEARNTAPVLNVLTSEAFERADPQSLIGCLALYIGVNPTSVTPGAISPVESGLDAQSPDPLRPAGPTY